MASINFESKDVQISSDLEANNCKYIPMAIELPNKHSDEYYMAVVHLSNVIQNRLLHLDEIFEQHGMWDGDQYMEMIHPLQESLRILSEKLE